MEGKPVRISRTVYNDHVLPPDTNNRNTIFGGKVMAFVDKVGAMTAMKHCRKPVVTASIDSMDFLAPVLLGETINLEACVTRAYRTSVEVYVTVRSEDLVTGKGKVTGSSYLTFVALDENGHPTEVPPVIPETDEEKRQYDTAQARYVIRQQRKQVRVEEHRRLGL
ncbi:acyl-CoA thioesterase [Alicyclobacillus sp. ALC3]|uniref:acyl-CoA thioesterase n=1 Tax=Alicyclobacillus sp. ALC3 TaxID=2796143 RepID=UPI0023797796|nr:acyl-CoA thioesterase [Alicyclobacillus sp. ALC3]WDL97995.1 acyl-CoA thioesterase [Alicyclobacillus sp. ALC3]